MFSKIKYIYSKILVKIQIPSIRNSIIDKTAKIGARSNVINTIVGKYSYMGNSCSISNVNIGKYCSISSYCSIGGGNHPINWVSTSPVFYTKHSALRRSYGIKKFEDDKKVIIGNDVWIGEKCFIKAGVTIGDGAVVGAHSVVTRDVPSYSIVVGSPAIVINYRFEKNIINDLLEIKWWDFEEYELDKYCGFFDSPEEFIKNYKE